MLDNPLLLVAQIVLALAEPSFRTREQSVWFALKPLLPDYPNFPRKP